MLNFDAWLRQPIAPTESAKELPEDIWEVDGKYMAECRRCGNRDEIPVDISEIPMTGYDHYCGRSPQCCP
jgi:hypothetical protein